MFFHSVLVILCSVAHCISAQDEELITFRDKTSTKTFHAESLKPNTITFLQLISDEIYKDDVTVNLKLSFLHLDSENGDSFLIGKGKRSDVLNGPPCLMYVETHTESQEFLVMGKDVTLAFVAREASDKRMFRIEWNRNGTVTDVPVTTSVPTTPVSEADRKAIILCFRRKALTCKEFHEPSSELLFRRRLADRANKYVEEKNIELPRRIISSDIKVRCLIIAGENNSMEVNSTRQNNFLIVTIVDKRNPEIPVFSTAQLSEIMRTFDTRTFDYDVSECRVYPNYWWWFWGSTFMLIFIIIMLLAFWMSTNQTFFQKSNSVEKLTVEKKEMNGQVNTGFVDEEILPKDLDVFSENSVPSTPTRRLPSLPVLDQDDPDNLSLSATGFRSGHNISFPPIPGNSALSTNMLVPKERERDSVSMYSNVSHIYEDVSRNKGPPSPSLSLRKTASDMEYSEL